LHDSKVLVAESTHREDSVCATDDVMDIATLIIGFLVACRCLILDTEFKCKVDVPDGSKQEQLFNEDARKEKIEKPTSYMDSNTASSTGNTIKKKISKPAAAKVFARLVKSAKLTANKAAASFNVSGAFVKLLIIHNSFLLKS
jgi:hypothetical protein